MGVEIVQATEATLREIEIWLREEQAVYEAAEADAQELDWDDRASLPTRGFLCNWNLVLRNFERDPSTVHVLLVDGAAAGFIWATDILEVRPDLRGKGYGRVLAEFMMERVRERGDCVVEIEVAPESALPFWRAMGFTPDPDRKGPGDGIYTYKRLIRTTTLGAGPRVPFKVAFYPRQRDWDETVAPFAVFDGLGEQLDDGSIRLPERAYGFDPGTETSPDFVVRIERAGECVFLDKVKRPAACAHGLQCDDGGVYFLDRIDV